METEKGKLKIRYEIYILTLTVFLFIFRTSFSLFKYPFFVLYTAFIIYYLINYWGRIKGILWDTFKYFLIVFILFGIMLLGFVLSNKLYLLIFKDLLNFLIVLSFFLLFSGFIRKKEHIYLVLNSLLDTSIFFSILIVILKLSLSRNIVSSSSLDYNFALIPILFGYLSVIFKLKEAKSKKIVLFYNFLLVLFTFDILFSGSRRGIIILIIILVSILTVHIISFFRIKPYFSKISSEIKYYTIFTFISFILLIFFILKADNVFKYRMLEMFDKERIYENKDYLASKLYRYFKWFEKDISYKTFYDKMWSHEYNPKDPRSGWGTRKHKIIYPLFGENVEIVPTGTLGYLMDSTCNSIPRWNNAYSFTRTASVPVNENDQIIAKVFCYVSEDFDGKWVRLTLEGAIEAATHDFYNLDKKGGWQELEVRTRCKEGNVAIYLYFSKYEAIDFSGMKGDVIFAYPTYQILDKKDSVIYDASKAHSQLFIDNSYDHKQKEYSLSKAFLLNFSKMPVLLNKNSNVKDIDPIRNWVKNLVREDTTYYAYKSDINTEYDPRSPLSGRTARWKFAWQIYEKEYNWKQKVFGNGFDYLNWYGYYFYNDKTKSDYPHNPFLSVLLYSGILGLLLYLYLMFKVVSIYLKYIREYYILFIFFGITFFFSFFSANTPFSPPIMGFFVLLPFFIDYINKKDKGS